jgi:hypothetical protein
LASTGSISASVLASVITPSSNCKGGCLPASARTDIRPRRLAASMIGARA